MHIYLVELLVCPACHGELEWHPGITHEDRVDEADAQCTLCHAHYPVRDGIGLFLTPDLPRDDLWEQSGSALLGYLREHPDVEAKLMDSPLDELSAADRFYRGMVLEERGEYDQARAALREARPGLYTTESIAAAERQKRYVFERVASAPLPIVDIASGRCELVEPVVRALQKPVVATDFSPRVLRRNGRWLRHFGLYDWVSLIAMDARRTPFRNGSAPTLTTHLGLANVSDPGAVLAELRRIAGGEFLAISAFYPSDDRTNLQPLRERGLAPALVRDAALGLFAAAGWQAEALNCQKATALPTPDPKLLPGAKIDAFPVAKTVLEWCVLRAT